jgi:hypothetical protein
MIQFADLSNTALHDGNFGRVHAALVEIDKMSEHLKEVRGEK